MSCKPSAETQLRAARRDEKELRAKCERLSSELAHYRGRATKAEQECAEWKRRFDLLLERTPRSPYE